MKCRSKLKWGLGMLLVLCVLMMSSVSWGRHEVGPQELVLPISYADIILHPDEMSEDLEFIIQTLKDVHPFLEHKENRQFFYELVKVARERIQEPLSRQDFYTVASYLVNFLDAQTHLWFQNEDRYLPLKLRWVSDGIMVTDVTQPYLPITVGDELISIGNIRPDELLDQLSSLLPFENNYRLYALGGSHLTAGYVLDALGVISKGGKVPMTFMTPAGEQYTVQIPWELADPTESGLRLLNPVEDPWYSWYVKKDLGYGLFRLDACKQTDEFLKDLDRFFVAVKATGVHNVVLDLRKNEGGDLDLVDVLLGYFPPQVIRYPVSQVRMSQQARERKDYSLLDYLYISLFHKVWDGEKAVLRPKDRDIIFEGNFFILTSNQTFAEANLLATILSDNGIATIVGEPTGNAPSSYGEALEFYTPNLGFYLTVSYKHFVRPEPKRDPADTLVPDHLVPTTIQDVRLGRDPQLEWIENYCKRLGL